MAVKIRLGRMGAKKNPFYRVVVADSRTPRDDRFIEELDYYSPLTEDKTVKVDAEKARKWIRNGARPTATVDHLFKANSVYEQEVKAEAEVKENEEAQGGQIW